MWMVLCFVLSCSYFLVQGFGNEQILGKGDWDILSYLECEDSDQYELRFGITRRKLNRTHDAFSLDADIDRDINVTYSVELIAKKKMDGGFKFYHRLTDESFCNWLDKYTGNNWKTILAMANIDPPECPIPVGKFKVEDFVIDYQQFEGFDCMYGTYDVSLYIVYMGQRITCVRALLSCEKHHENDDDDEY